MTSVNKVINFISTAQAAKLLGVSRVSIFNRIKSGQIHAEKVGRNYLIHLSDIEELLDKKLQIRKAVEKTLDDYGETIRLLGKE